MTIDFKLNGVKFIEAWVLKTSDKVEAFWEGQKKIPS